MANDILQITYEDLEIYDIGSDNYIQPSFFSYLIDKFINEPIDEFLKKPLTNSLVLIISFTMLLILTIFIVPIYFLWAICWIIYLCIMEVYISIKELVFKLIQFRYSIKIYKGRYKKKAIRYWFKDTFKDTNRLF